jgi:hypothetical protein
VIFWFGKAITFGVGLVLVVVHVASGSRLYFFTSDIPTRFLLYTMYKLYKRAKALIGEIAIRFRCPTTNKIKVLPEYLTERTADEDSMAAQRPMNLQDW